MRGVPSALLVPRMSEDSRVGSLGLYEWGPCGWAQFHRAQWSGMRRRGQGGLCYSEPRSTLFPKELMQGARWPLVRRWVLREGCAAQPDRLSSPTSPSPSMGDSPGEKHLAVHHSPSGARWCCKGREKPCCMMEHRGSRSTRGSPASAMG